MIVQVFSLYDTVAGAFQLPFYQHNIPLAIQFVEDQLQDATPTNRLRKLAKSLILHHIGSFDDSTSTFTSIPPVSLGVLESWLAPLMPRKEHEEVFSPPHSAALNK